jgi:hypothetical protein
MGWVGRVWRGVVVRWVVTLVGARIAECGRRIWEESAVFLFTHTHILRINFALFGLTHYFKYCNDLGASILFFHFVGCCFHFSTTASPTLLPLR